MAELAEAAGITVRTLRFYRERKLLPPPRREGRIAWYTEHHLARLRTIAALLERGHTLGGIAELLAAFESGRDVGEVLGLADALPMPWPQETPVKLTPQELADYFTGEVTPENLAASLDLGYLAVDGDDFVHVSRRLLDASRELVGKGVPLSAVLAAGRELRQHMDAVSETFTRLVRTHVLADAIARAAAGDGPTADEAAHITKTLETLRQNAKSIVDAELSLSLDRHIRAELEKWIDRPPSGRAGEDAGGQTGDQAGGQVTEAGG
ncbi:MerR family transcriptional regulator [Streptomyces sp. 796.1]|uniref:MerR family transcriptional regulator n=1 Tax=Streptomyces sp. 796.1 TaxID=3163029 RepID=UPI0039C8F262